MLTTLDLNEEPLEIINTSLKVNSSELPKPIDITESLVKRPRNEEEFHIDSPTKLDLTPDEKIATYKSCLKRHKEEMEFHKIEHQYHKHRMEANANLLLKANVEKAKKTSVTKWGAKMAPF